MSRRSNLVAVVRLSAIVTVLVLVGGTSAEGRVPVQAEPTRESHASSVLPTLRPGSSYSPYVVPDGASHGMFILPHGASHGMFILPGGASYGPA